MRLKRAYTLRVRLSAEEHQRLVDLAENVSLSRYVRRLIGERKSDMVDLNALMEELTAANETLVEARTKLKRAAKAAAEDLRSKLEVGDQATVNGRIYRVVEAGYWTAQADMTYQDGTPFNWRYTGRRHTAIVLACDDIVLSTSGWRGFFDGHNNQDVEPGPTGAILSTDLDTDDEPACGSLLYRAKPHHYRVFLTDLPELLRLFTQQSRDETAAIHELTKG